MSKSESENVLRNPDLNVKGGLFSALIVISLLRTTVMNNQRKVKRIRKKSLSFKSGGNYYFLFLS